MTKRTGWEAIVVGSGGARGLHVVGDTAFPGQGTLAVAMSAALAAERLGAVRLGRDGSLRLLAGGTR